MYSTNESDTRVFSIILRHPHHLHALWHGPTPKTFPKKLPSKGAFSWRGGGDGEGKGSGEIVGGK